MIPPGLRNPFLVQKVDDTVHVPAGNVPELHAGALAKCSHALEQSRVTGQSIGLLISGEAGSGKSHMIAQLRSQLVSEADTVLVAIPLRGAYSGRLWRHLREQLVPELLRQYPPGKHGGNGLLRILRNRFPQWATTAETTHGGLLTWLVGRSRSSGDLQPFLDQFAQTCTFDYGLQKVLPRLAAPELTSLAHAWLRGQLLGGEDLDRLGLPRAFPTDQEQEANAREVILSFFRLAGDLTTLLICFDEIEALQAGVGDAEVLRQFTTLATDLLATSGPRLVVTSIRPQTLLELRKAVEHSNMQKIGQDHATIPPLTWEQAVRVVFSRLEADKTCRNARKLHPENRFWPLSESFVEGVYQSHRRSLTPRHLIRACAVEFNRLAKGPAAPDPGTAEPDDTQVEIITGKIDKPSKKPSTQDNKTNPAEPSSTKVEKLAPATDSGDEFSRMWERQRKKHLERIEGIQFDSLMALALPWLVDLNRLPFVRVQETDRRLGDVNLLFQPEARGKKFLGVSFCNQEPKFLWHRLDRVLAQWQAAKGKRLDTLIVLRSESQRTTKKAEDRLANLKKAGVTILEVDRQQLAELAAFQVMLTEALAGNLTRHGDPIETREYDDWAREHMSDAVKEFFHLVFEPEPGQTPSIPTAGNTTARPAARR